jgi:hypothetical protein
VQAELAERGLVVRARLHGTGVDEVAPRREGDVDAARVVAVHELEVAVCRVRDPVDVVGEEGLQDAEVVDLLQRQDVGAGFGDGEAGELALVVLDRDRDGGLHGVARLGFGEVEQGQGRRGLGPLHRAVAVAGREVLDVEGCDAKAHARAYAVRRMSVGASTGSFTITTSAESRGLHSVS